MECLICYKVYFNRPESSPDPDPDFDISFTISKLFDISSSSWLTDIDTFGPLSICPDCTEKLGQVHRMLQELDQIQSCLKRIKGEVFADLIKSQELSQKNGFELKERSKIVQEISKAKENVGKRSSINSETGSLSADVKMLASDHIESIADDSKVTQPESTSKNQEIILEPLLPFQYSFSDDSNNAKDEETPKRRKRRTRKKLTQAQTTSKERKRKSKLDAAGLIKHCNICNITFERNKKYLAHYRKVHTGERPFHCDKCPKNFFSEEYLRSHLKSHETESSGQKIKCPYKNCEKIFSTTFGLSAHIKTIHEKAFRFFCQVENCGKGFINESGLRRHNDRTHLKVKPFLCDKCPDKKFYFMSELNLHYLNHHADESERPQPHQCKYCSKAFVSKPRLQRHLKLHTGIRDQVCHICGEEYAVKSALDLHIANIHFGIYKNIKTAADITKRRKGSRRNRVPIIPDIPIEELNDIICNNAPNPISTCSN